ncbi:hypothetical protein V6Z12_D02G195200 [Gossypium hirsutum]
MIEKSNFAANLNPHMIRIRMVDALRLHDFSNCQRFNKWSV